MCILQVQMYTPHMYTVHTVYFASTHIHTITHHTCTQTIHCQIDRQINGQMDRRTNRQTRTHTTLT